MFILLLTSSIPVLRTAEIKITIVKNFVTELVLIMTLLSRYLIETEHALKQIFKILMRPRKDI